MPAPPVPELFERRLRLRYPPLEPDANAGEGEAVPIVRIDPQWPREALMDGTEGYVRCEVLIGPDGSVLDVRVLEAAPGRLFVRNAVRAVRRWKFKPRIVDGIAVERWAMTSIVFELDNGSRSREAHRAEGESSDHAIEGDYLPIVKVAPMYPRRAQSQGLEGYCDLEFTVTPLGTTTDVRVIECTSSLFERASVQALLKFKYKPRVVGGTAIPTPRLQHRITFQIED